MNDDTITPHTYAQPAPLKAPAFRSIPVQAKSNTAHADLLATHAEARNALAAIEAKGAGRQFSPSEDRDYRSASAAFKAATLALDAYTGTRSADNATALGLALESAENMEPGTARSVALRDMGYEYRGTSTLVEGTAGVGGNTVTTGAPVADIFQSYADHRDLLTIVGEQLVTTRAKSLDVPSLSAGVTLTSPGEATAVVVSDVAFDMTSLTWTKTNVRTVLSSELISDSGYPLEATISAEHGRAAARTIENAAVAAYVAAAGGTVAAAPTTLATILDGAGTVEAAGWTPSLCVLTPASWLTLRKANSGQLGSPAEFQRITGLRLVLSSGIAAATGLVLDASTVTVYRRDLTPTRVIRNGSGFSSDTVDVVSSWRFIPHTLAAGGTCKLAV